MFSELSHGQRHHICGLVYWFDLLKVYVIGLRELSLVQLQENIKGLLLSDGNQVNLIQDEVYRISRFEFINLIEYLLSGY